MRAFILVAMIACIVSAPTAALAQSAKPTPVAYLVVGEDHALAAKFEANIARLIRAKPGYRIEERFPLLKLVVLVNQDVNDHTNRNGISIAIIYVSNMQVLSLASKLMDSQQSDVVAVKGELTDLVGEPGEVQTINVAHIDRASESEVNRVCKLIVAKFFEKVPPDAAK